MGWTTMYSIYPDQYQKQWRPICVYISKHAAGSYATQNGFQPAFSKLQGSCMTCRPTLIIYGLYSDTWTGRGSEDDSASHYDRAEANKRGEFGRRRFCATTTHEPGECVEERAQTRVHAAITLCLQTAVNGRERSSTISSLNDSQSPFAESFETYTSSSATPTPHPPPLNSLSILFELSAATPTSRHISSILVAE
nr:hypothetical protein CFP56_07555 [Quercus suber]